MDMVMWWADRPLLSFSIIWVLGYLVTRSIQEATQASMDITFLLLLAAVSDQLRAVAGSAWLVWLLVFILVLAAGLRGRRREERRGGVHPLALYIWIARPGFLLFLVIYVGLQLAE